MEAYKWWFLFLVNSQLAAQTCKTTAIGKARPSDIGGHTVPEFAYYNEQHARSGLLLTYR